MPKVHVHVQAHMHTHTHIYSCGHNCLWQATSTDITKQNKNVPNDINHITKLFYVYATNTHKLRLDGFRDMTPNTVKSVRMKVNVSS